MTKIDRLWDAENNLMAASKLVKALLGSKEMHPGDLSWWDIGGQPSVLDRVWLAHLKG